MPSFLQRALAGLIAGGIADAVIAWFASFAHDTLDLKEGEFETIAARITDAAYLDALVVNAFDKLPEAETFRVFRKTVRIPLKNVISPTVLALLLAGTVGKQQIALDRAHAALTDAYRTAIRKTER